MIRNVNTYVLRRKLQQISPETKKIGTAINVTMAAILIGQNDSDLVVARNIPPETLKNHKTKNASINTKGKDFVVRFPFMSKT